MSETVLSIIIGAILVVAVGGAMAEVVEAQINVHYHLQQHEANR